MSFGIIDQVQWGRVMNKTFIEMKLFQVKPDKLEQFEAKIEEMTANQFKCEGCICKNC